MFTFRLTGIVPLMLLVLSLQPAQSVNSSSTIRAVDLGHLGGSAGSTFAADLNDAGQVVGTTMNPAGHQRAYRWSAATGMIELGTLGGTTSSASAVGPVGHVIGTSSLADEETTRPFLWKDGGPMVNLGTLPGHELATFDPRAVNASGVVVGNLNPVNGGLRAWRWTAAGGMRELPGLGGEFTAAVAINTGGTVVGSSQLPTGEIRAVLWTPAGAIRELGHLGGGYSNAVAINDAGQIAGNSNPGTGTDQAFIWEKGKMTSLGSLTGSLGSSYVTDINSTGQVCGTSGVPWPGSQRAFRWSKQGGMVDLGSLELNQMSEAHALNDAGQVIGTAIVNNGWRAFVWTPGAGMVNMGTLFFSSYGLDINNNGLVLGYAESPVGTRTFVASGSGALTDIGSLGGGRSEATAINDLGEIVGESLSPGLWNHAFFRGTDGVLVDLGTLGAEHARPVDVNNRGEVIVQVGTNAATGERAFFWSRATGRIVLSGLGGDYWGVVDINNRGQVAGHSFTANNEEVHATIWTVSGGLIDIGIPGEDSFVSAINDDGHVVGVAGVRGTGESYAWVWKPGAGMKNLGTFGGAVLLPADINNKGTIAGRAENVLGAGSVAWSWKGVFSNLGGPAGQIGGTQIVRALNEMGTVIGRGYQETTGQVRAFAGGSVPLRDLGTLPGDLFSDARAINDSGEIVGVSGTRDTDDPTWKAFLVRGAGPMTDLGALGGTFAHANAINAHGQAVGQAERLDGARHAVLWNTR